MNDTKTVSGTIVHVTDADEAPLVKCLVSITPKQSGSGTPSPSNVRPISGWESVSVYVRGKNLFDEVYTNIYDGLRYKAIFVGNGTFTMSTTTPKHPDGANLFFLAGQVTTGVSTNSNGVWANQNRTVASVNGYVTIAYRILGGVSEYSPVNYETQIEVGTTATEYQPYNLNSHTTTTPLGRTVYGGTLDVVSGELKVTHGYQNYNGSENWQADSGRYTIGVSGSYREGYTRIPVTSNEGVFGTGSSVGTIFLSNAQLYYYPPTSVTSLANFKTWLASNNLQVVYPLATPQTYTLTGQEISTLYGENYIWANAGDIDIEYTYLPYGLYGEIRLDGNFLPKPRNFMPAREDVYAGEYTTCTGKTIADRIGWKFSDLDLQWDALKQSDIDKLINLTNACSLRFDDADGLHTEDVIRSSAVSLRNRNTVDGETWWRNVSVQFKFIDTHNND